MNFEALLSRLDPKIETVFGETFTLVPMRELDSGRPQPDDTRDSVEFVATFDERAQKQEHGDGNRVSAQPRVTFTGLPALRKADRMVRARTGLTYEVTAIYPDGLGRVLAVLVEVAA